MQISTGNSFFIASLFYSNILQIFVQHNFFPKFVRASRAVEVEWYYGT